MPILLEKKFTPDFYLTLYRVEIEEAGLRFDQFVMSVLPAYSRQQIKKRIAAGEIFIINRPDSKRPSVKLHAYDEVQILIVNTEHEDEWWRGEKIQHPQIVKCLEDNEDFIVCSKPPFMSTHPTGRHLFYCATVYFENIYQKTIHSVHRIDRETSGILLLAKNPKSAQRLTQSFLDDKVRKAYFFISHKINPRLDMKAGTEWRAEERMGSITTMSSFSEDEGQSNLSEEELSQERVFIKYFPKDSTDGKEATTDFKILHVFDKHVLGLAFPVTGRQHQIRVHAQAYGIPLLGDKIYHGGIPLFKRFKDLCATDEDHDLMEIPRQALHAIGLTIQDRSAWPLWIDQVPSDLQEWLTITYPDYNLEKLHQNITSLLKNEFLLFKK